MKGKQGIQRMTCYNTKCLTLHLVDVTKYFLVEAHIILIKGNVGLFSEIPLKFKEKHEWFIIFRNNPEAKLTGY